LKLCPYILNIKPKSLYVFCKKLRTVMSVLVHLMFEQIDNTRPHLDRIYDAAMNLTSKVGYYPLPLDRRVLL